MLQIEDLRILTIFNQVLHGLQPDDSCSSNQVIHVLPPDDYFRGQMDHVFQSEDL